MKTIIFHRTGSWKYTVISRVKSSKISVFRWDLGSTRMPRTLIIPVRVEIILRKQQKSVNLSNIRQSTYFFEKSITELLVVYKLKRDLQYETRTNHERSIRIS